MRQELEQLGQVNFDVDDNFDDLLADLDQHEKVIQLPKKKNLIRKVRHSLVGDTGWGGWWHAHQYR